MFWQHAASALSLGRALPPVLAIAAAGWGFYGLRQGSVMTGAAAPGYAETLRHAVGPLEAGRLEALHVGVGQRVKAGEAVATMDGSVLRLARESALARVRAARAKAEAETQGQDLAVTRAELWVLKARASERGDRAELTEVDRQLGRLNGLAAQQLLSSIDAEAGRVRQRALEARVETYDQAIGLGRAGLDGRERSRGHAEAVRVLTEPARQAVLVEESALKQLDAAIERLTLRAPVEGCVSTLSRRAGDVVGAGDEVVSVVTTRPGVIVAVVPERSARRLVPGSKAEVRRDTLFSPVVEGRVIELGPEIEEVPVRARPSPGIPAWGRRALVELGPGEEALPGEAFYVSFR